MKINFLLILQELGIGTDKPQYVFDLKIEDPTSFDPGNSTSWNALRLGFVR